MIGAIEDKMLDAIRAADLGYTLKKIESYGGEFSEGIDKQVRNFPAVLLVFAGSRVTKTTNIRTTLTATWNVICCAKNLRNESDARKGSDDKVGSYQIVEDMIGILSKKKFGLEITPLETTGIEPLLNDKSENQLASVYGVNFETSFEIGQTEAVNPRPGDFETWHANWDVPTHGNVPPPYPNDDDADATDNVTLETAP